MVIFVRKAKDGERGEARLAFQVDVQKRLVHKPLVKLRVCAENSGKKFCTELNFV